MCAVAERLNKTIKDVMAELKPLKKAIPLICSDRELPSSIARFTMNLKEAVDALAPKVINTIKLVQPEHPAYIEDAQSYIQGNEPKSIKDSLIKKDFIIVIKTKL